MQNKPRVLVIAGPTASGKTSLAVELALRLNGAVISADSMQIYKGMPIGTAQPSDEEKKGVEHFLMDFLPVSEEYSVARFVPEAKNAIESVLQSGKTPIVCGGTGLYISSLIDNLSFIDVGKDEKLREELREKCRTEGFEALVEELRQVDPEEANALEKTGNPSKIIRAIEMYRVSGMTMAQQRELSRKEPSPYDFDCFTLDFHDRNVLYDRINMRVDKMLDGGLLTEAREALENPYKCTASQAIAHKEFKAYFDGDATLEEAADKLKLETRHYAKRQLTWFRRDERFKHIYMDDFKEPSEAASVIEKLFLGQGG